MTHSSPTYSPVAGRRVLWPQVALAGAALVLALLIARLPLPYAVALIAGVVVVGLVLTYPLAGLGLALLLGPFGALENIILGNALLDSGQLLLLLTVGAWLAASLARRRVWLARTPVNLPLVLFIGAAAFTLLSADSLPLGARELLKWVEMALIILLVVDVATDGGRDLRRLPTTARWLLGFLFLAGLTQALVGVWQFGPRGTGPETFLILGRFYRAYGTFEQPNPFGGYMNLTALLALGTTWGLLMARFSWNTRIEDDSANGPILSPQWLWLLVAGFVAAVGSLALVLSWSRGAWLGFLAGLAGAGPVQCPALVGGGGAVGAGCGRGWRWSGGRRGGGLRPGPIRGRPVVGLPR